MLCLHDLCIEIRDLVYERELVVLELLFDVLLDSILVVNQKFNIKHCISPSADGIRFCCITVHFIISQFCRRVKSKSAPN